jgi:large subunit ribosomal protein L2
MALKKYRPLTPSLRYKLSSDFAEITADKPEKSLIVKTNYSSGGRNNSGKMTMRYIGGGHKKYYVRSISNAIRTG